MFILELQGEVPQHPVEAGEVLGDELFVELAFAIAHLDVFGQVD